MLRMSLRRYLTQLAMNQMQSKTAIKLSLT